VHRIKDVWIMHEVQSSLLFVRYEVKVMNDMFLMPTAIATIGSHWILVEGIEDAQRACRSYADPSHEGRECCSAPVCLPNHGRA